MDKLSHQMRNSLFTKAVSLAVILVSGFSLLYFMESAFGLDFYGGSENSPEAMAYQLTNDKEFDATQIIVRYKEGTPESSKKGTKSPTFGKKDEDMFVFYTVDVTNNKEGDLSKFSTAENNDLAEPRMAQTQFEKANVAQALVESLSDANVESATPNYLSQTQWTPTDWNASRH